MSESFLRQFALPSFQELEAAARGREVREDAVLTGGSAPVGKHGPIGINIGIGQRQTRFWLPADHPRFAELAPAVQEAVRNTKPVTVQFDPVGYVLLDVERT